MEFLLCISLGHGEGSRERGEFDPGALGEKWKEANIVRVFGLRCARDLSILKVPVVVRDDGYFSSADDEAKAAKATHMVELHCDAAGLKANGTGTFYHSRGGSKAWAASMVNAVSNALGNSNRGARQGDSYAVLQPKRGMKAMILELFFITNAGDRARWSKRQDKAELAFVNNILITAGRRPVRSLPRKWNPVRRFFIRYI